MALKIRLARGGSKKRPYYRIVVAEASSPRDGRFVERLGSYNPMVPKDHPERLTLDGERAMHWVSKGAKPTERVQKMMAGLGLLEAPALRDQPKKSAPGKKRQEREAEAAADDPARYWNGRIPQVVVIAPDGRVVLDQDGQVPLAEINAAIAEATGLPAPELPAINPEGRFNEVNIEVTAN